RPYPRFRKADLAPPVAANPFATAGLAPSHTLALPPSPRTIPSECAGFPKCPVPPSHRAAIPAAKRFHLPSAEDLQTATIPPHPLPQPTPSESIQRFATKCAKLFPHEGVNKQF